MAERKPPLSHAPSVDAPQRVGAASTSPSVLQVVQAAAAAFSRGQWRDAERLARMVLQTKPEDFVALNILGIIALQLQRPSEAEVLLRRASAVNPGDAWVHNNRGNSLKDLGRLDEALQCYERALQINAHFAEACSNRGIVLQSLGRLEAALESFDRALKIKPGFAEAHGNRGVVLQKLGRPDDALDSYDRALQNKPDSAVVHINRGNVLKDLLRVEEAIASYDCALHINEGFAEAHSGRGNALKDLGRLDEALASYDRALDLKPHVAEFHNNRGNALKDLGRFDEAIESYDRALQINPRFAEAEFNRSRCRLLIGDFARGWAGYESRWRTDHMRSRSFTQPLWLGKESLADKTILLHGEQGLGDTLQFCRYARLVAESGARVLLEVPRSLSALSSDLAGVSQVIVSGEPLPSFDFHCPLMSLPHAFGTTLESIPLDIPYIRPNADKSAYWGNKLGARRRLRAGLVWSGGIHQNQLLSRHVNQRRNIAFSDICSLKSADVDFYSLQKGEPAQSEIAEQRDLLWPEDNLFDFTDELTDFSDTAALIENLDLVISVDTSTAHLAGAMGKPVWILNRFDTCWRWLMGRTDSPWYPSVRLFRQPVSGDWLSVLQAVREALPRHRTRPS